MPSGHDLDAPEVSTADTDPVGMNPEEVQARADSDISVDIDASGEESVVKPVTGDVVQLIDPESLPTLPEAGLPQDEPAFVPQTDEVTKVWESLVVDYEREANAIGTGPRAAALFLEIGRIHEERLARPREAATSYQKAFNLNPLDPAVLHASRRLFTEVENWAMVVQILGYEIECAKSIEKKATLLAEKGTILEEKLKNAEEAQKAFGSALDAWSAEPLAINALERMYLVSKDYEPLLSVYERALASTSQRERRMPLLLAAAQLSEDRIGDKNGAVRFYAELAELDPKSTVALAALRRLHQQLDHDEPMLATLRASADGSEGQEAAYHLLAAARIQHRKLEQVDRALMSLLEALEHAPEDQSILREIEYLYEQNDRYDEVVKVLRRRAEVTTEPIDRVPIYHKLGIVLDDKLGLPDEAIAPLEESFRLRPKYIPVRQALGRLYTTTGRFEDLAALFDREAQLEVDRGIRVATLFRLAEVQDQNLDSPDEAVDTLERILGMEPEFQPARKFLEELLQRLERWDGLIALYEQEIDLLGEADDDQKVFLLGRIGLLAEDKLDDIDRAARAFDRILAIKPGHRHAISTLGRLAMRREAWADVAKYYDLEVEATRDQAEVVSILHRLGNVLEDKLGDEAGALAQYEKVLVLNPTYLPALKSLGRLYHRLERWNDLASMYRRELDVTKSDERKVSLYFRLADVHREHLSDDEAAIEDYERILQIDATNEPAIEALVDMHARLGHSEPLVEVLGKQALSVKSDPERSDLLMRQAAVCEEQLDRADQAAELYQEVLRIGHHVDPAVRALVRIYSAEGMWNALSRALNTAQSHATHSDAKAAILVRYAEIQGEKLGNLDAAVGALEEAALLRPDDITLLSQLERAAVARRDWKRAIEVASVLADQETDPRLYAARQIRIATMKETQLDPPESGSDNYRSALERLPNHSVALRALELAYLRAHNWEGLHRFYHREALVTADGHRRATLFCRAGDVAEMHLGDLEGAGRMYDLAIEGANNYLPAVRGRRRIAEAQGDAERVLNSIREEGEMTSDPAHARELLFQAGQLYQDQYGDTDQAIDTYRRVLDLSPDHKGAFTRLEGLYEEKESFELMLRLNESRAAAIEAPIEQAELHLSAARISQDHLADNMRARAALEQVLDRDPNNSEALVRLGPILFAHNEWDEAISVFHRTLAVNKEPDVMLNCFKSLGIIYQQHRQDLVKCVQSFQAALQASPSDADSLRSLASVYGEAQDWGSAINVLLRLAEVEEDPRSKVETLLRLAHVYQTGAQDRRNAILANRKVLEIDPTNQTAILRLSDLYEAEGEWQSLADVTAAYVRLLPADQKDKAAPLHLKMADVFENNIRDDGRAINALKYALEAQPDNVTALERLAVLYGKSPDTAPQAVDVHRRLLRFDPFRIESYRKMYDIFRAAREHDKAFVIAEVLVFLRAHTQEEDLYYQEHKTKVAPSAAGRLDAQELDRWVVHPSERGPMRQVLEVLSSELARSYPGNLEQYGVTKANRHGPRSDLPLRRLANEIGDVLGAPSFDMWLSPKDELGIHVENAKPIALIVGAQVGRRIQAKEQSFMLGRALEQIKGGHHLLEHLSPKELEGLMWSVAEMADPSVQHPVDPATMDNSSKMLAKSIDRRVRKLLEELGRHIPRVHVDMLRHKNSAIHTANRAGLVVTNSVESSVRSIVKGYANIRPVFSDAAGAANTIGQIQEVRELLGFAVSEEYFRTRAKLGFSIESGL